MTDTDQPEIDKYTETDDEGRQVFGEEFRKKYPVLGKFGSAMMAPNRNIIGREYEKSQLLAAMNRPEICNALLLAPPGSGKSHPDDTLIAVNDDRGYIRIGDAVIGDEIFGEDGAAAPISGVFPQGKKRVFKVVTKDGSETLCNDEHIWSVKSRDDRKRGKPYREMTLREIMDRGVVLNDGSYRWTIPVGKAVRRQQIDLPADPYAVGALIGDKSPDRRIPEVYFTGSVDQRMEFLRGLFDSDGTVGANDRTVVSFSTMGEGLAHDVKRLLASVGIRSTVTPSVREGKSTEHVVFVKLPDRRKHELFSLPRHVETIEDFARYDDRTWHKNYDEMAIVSIEDLGYETDQTCIMVDNESHLYQVGREHVVTHNTALVQATMLDDTDRVYLELDLATMISEVSTADKLAGMIKKMFNEAAEYAHNEAGKELVLFIDEFHQIIQLSEAAVEALKPGLAASGVLGIRVIAATTFEEFHKHIADNQPLVERLQRINVAPPDSATTVRILREMAARYDVIDQFYDDHVFEMIHELTERYQPASVQPRKSILLLDSMVGWHRLTDRPMDRHLLADVLKETTGINVAFRVDASKIKKTLDSKVYGQDLATRTLANRLQLAVADLQDKGKPISSFLFAGATGTGKTELTKQLARLLFGDDKGHLIRFDMSEYSLEDSVHAFRSELTKRVWDMGHAVILFDEIEKASRNVTRMLLQVLDDGRLTNDVGRQVSFLNTYIVLTTNAGSEIFDNIARYNVDDDGSGEEMANQLKKIKRSIIETQDEGKFPPELIGRIDQVVPFQPLSENTFQRVVINKLSSFVRDVMSKHGVEVGMTDRVITYLIGDKLNAEASEGGGARGAIQQMNEEVFTAVAEFVNHYPEKKSIMVDIKGEMRSENKHRLKSPAKPVVYEKK